jgi:hypothetical protein
MGALAAIENDQIRAPVTSMKVIIYQSVIEQQINTMIQVTAV